MLNTTMHKWMSRKKIKLNGINQRVKTSDFFYKKLLTKCPGYVIIKPEDEKGDKKNEKNLYSAPCR